MCINVFCYYSGVLYNIRYTIPVCSFNELLQAVVKVLAQVLDVNCFDVISKLLPEPTKVFCGIFYDVLTIFRENFMHRGFCPVREQWVKMLAHNYNLSDHWSKELLFDLFVSHVFWFFLRPFFVKNLVIILHIFSCGLSQIVEQILLCQKLVNLCKYNNIVSYFALSWPYNYDQMAL